MVVGKFYCHACGARLKQHKKTRVVRHGDADYAKYNDFGSTRNLIPSDIELTEYDFCCPCCEAITTYEAQRIIQRIQKEQGKHILTEAEIAFHTPKAEASLAKRARVWRVCVTIVSLALTALIFYLCNPA